MKLVIFGTSVFSRLMKKYIEEDTNDEIVAFTVDEKYMKESELEGIQIVPFEKLREQFDMHEIAILITCGYHKMNDIRKDVFLRCKKEGYNIASFIHSSAIVSGVTFGEGNIVLPHALLHNYITIGNGNVIGEFAMIEQESKIGDFNFIGPKTFLGGFCKVGNNNDFGISGLINDRVEIGNYNIIGSGAVLASNIEDTTVVAPPTGRIQKGDRRFMDIMVSRW